MLRKAIVFAGQPAAVVCDGKCSKAWGINTRPRLALSAADPDDYCLLADDEIPGDAPEDPGTYEGGHAKPVGVTSAEQMNKWCVRECERCQMNAPGETERGIEPKLRDFSIRWFNIPRGTCPRCGIVFLNSREDRLCIACAGGEVWRAP